MSAHESRRPIGDEQLDIERGEDSLPASSPVLPHPSIIRRRWVLGDALQPSSGLNVPPNKETE